MSEQDDILNEIFPKSVYLSGSIEHNEDGHDWWDDITGLFEAEGFKTLDPTKGQEELEERCSAASGDKTSVQYKDAIYEIVNKDIIMTCVGHGSFVRYCEGVRRGAGTHGEITLHRAIGLPVVVWANGYDKQDIPGWVWGCTNYIINDKEAAVHTLIELVKINISSDTYMITLAIQELMKGLIGETGQKNQKRN